MHALCYKPPYLWFSNFRHDGAGQVEGKPISKQRLFKLLVKCIKFAYDQNNLSTPEGVKGHLTRKMAVTYADMDGADPQTICEAACWQKHLYVCQVLPA